MRNRGSRFGIERIRELLGATHGKGVVAEGHVHRRQQVQRLNRRPLHAGRGVPERLQHRLSFRRRVPC